MVAWFVVMFVSFHLFSTRSRLFLLLVVSTMQALYTHHTLIQSACINCQKAKRIGANIVNFPQQHRVRCPDQQQLLTPPGIKEIVINEGFETQKTHWINQVEAPSGCAVFLQQVLGTMFTPCSIHSHFLPKKSSTLLPAGERNLCEYARDLYYGDLLFQVPSARTHCHCPSKSGDPGRYFYLVPLTDFHNSIAVPSHR